MCYKRKRTKQNCPSLKEIYGFESLYESMMKCKKGVLWKNSVASFVLNDMERISKLAGSLQNGTYKAKKPYRFKIHHPKEREIASISFRDRVPQRSLNDNIVYPVMTRSFIYDNYACQKGKGTDKARNRLKQFLQRHYRKCGCSGWVAQFDIKGFYPNMDHAIVEGMFKQKLPQEVFVEVRRILREQYDGEKGYNPGSQLVQIAGISILDGLDHFIKEKLHAKLYLRYMDDFMIISEDKQYLERCVAEIAAYLKRLRFEINQKKTMIIPLSEGIEFLGFIYKLTGTGKVVMNLLPKNIKSQRRKMRRMAAKVRRGSMTQKQANDSFEAWKAHALKGASYKLIHRMNNYYKSLLWEGNT